MDKPIGGVRPIALMSMIYKFCTKIRHCEVRKWAAIRGSSALQAAVLSAFFNELHTFDGKEVASILWDLDKFYDSIDLGTSPPCIFHKPVASACIAWRPFWTYLKPFLSI